MLNDTVMKKFILILIAGTMTFSVQAQQIPFFGQYTVAPMVYNPAYAGIDSGITAGLMHRTMWRGLPGAPQSSVFMLDAPINVENIGIGGMVFNDVTDIFQRVGVYSAYSYKLKLNDDMRLHFGLSLGILNNRIDLSRAIVNDANDPYVLYNQIPRRSTFDGTFGTVFIWKDLQTGFAIPQLFSSKMKYLTTEAQTYYRLQRHLLFHAKYNFEIDKEKGMSVYPMAIIRYAPGAPFQFDFNGVFDWQKYGWFGISYRHGYAMGFNLGFRVKSNLRAGYTYDLAINKVKNFIGSAHELYLGYTFGKERGDKDREKK